MKKILRNRKGSVTVFVVLIFSAMVILIFALITNAKSVAIEGSAKELCKVWGNSVLGEYDRNLFKDYGILGYYGYESTANDTIRYYAEKTANEKNYITLGRIASKLSEYSLGQVDNFKKQVVESAKVSLTDVGDLLEKNKKTGDRTEGREIINQKIIKTLPSQGASNSISIDAIVSALKEIVSGDGSLTEKAGEKFFIQRFIIYYFDDYITQTSKSNPYFRDEKEYLLIGEKSDDENLSGFKTRFIAVRNAINLAYLYTDIKKQEITLALAEALTPGPAAPATQLALNEAWALFEARNDWKLIINNRKVPILKTSSNWALDEGVLKDKDWDGFVDNDSPEGLTYGNYLNFFLTLQDENITLLRMMDLIQINMRFNYYGDFLISEYNTGLDFTININGDDFNYECKY